VPVCPIQNIINIGGHLVGLQFHSDRRWLSGCYTSFSSSAPLRDAWSNSLCVCVCVCVCVQGSPKIGTMFVCLITLSDINRFSKFFDCKNQETIFNHIITKVHMPLHKCVATLPCEMSLSGANCRSVSLITPLVSGVASLSALSSSKADTLNI